jgi:transcriptional regulator with XRE-family HTH domain
MKTFGEAFKKARVAKRVTLREISEHIGKSIGYLSDIEQGRKGPPDLEMVRKIEVRLGIEDHSLANLASKLRSRVPPDLTRRIQMRPQLSELLLRADDLSDEDIKDLISEAKLKSALKRKGK